MLFIAASLRMTMLRSEDRGGTCIDSLTHWLTHSHLLTHLTHWMTMSMIESQKSFMLCANLLSAISKAHSEVQHLECSTRLWCDKLDARLKNSLIEWLRIRYKIASCATQAEHQATCGNSAKRCTNQYFLVMLDVAREGNDVYKKPKPAG